MFEKISLFCFAASYGVALLLEISRLFFRMPVRHVVMVGFGAAGLLAHTLYLINNGRADISQGVPFSSWYLWYLMAAWIPAAVYVGWAWTQPQTAVGIFLLPVVLALVGAATFADPKPFPRENAQAFWVSVHGISLLMGTVITALGFVAGLMYLVQSYRLKLKLPPRPGFRLPSLEWLQTVNKQSLYCSTLLTAGGLLSGVILNMIRNEKVPWTDRVVVSSTVLLAWLFAATLFELVYKPAQQGRKVAYLTVTGFVFLALVIGMLLFSNSKHAVAAPRADVTIGREVRA